MTRQANKPPGESGLYGAGHAPYPTARVGSELGQSGVAVPGPGALLAGTLRAFVALELSPEVRAVVAALLGRLSRLEAARIARVRWTAAENLHLTLKFLGRVETTQLPAIQAGLAQAAASQGPLTLTVTGAGAFPDVRAPQVLWLGVGAAEGALVRLAAAVEAQLAPLGFPTENRTFSPHLTLGRVGVPRHARPLAETLVEMVAGLDEAMVEEEMVFFKSELRPEGARHTPLFRIPLSRGGRS